MRSIDPVEDLTASRDRITAVVVSFNRRDLLLDSLAALLAQTRQPDRILVVDNASTDGSAEAARSMEGVDVLALESNTGGAGGFAVGLAAALADGADWVWVMDDDTIPTDTALQELLRHRAAGVVMLGSRAVWIDGTDHPMNTPRRWPLTRRARPGTVPVRSLSFVSMLVRADRVRARGLPIADYFIWNDDFEFSTRMARGASAVFVPSSVVEHRTARPVSTDADPGDRFYYEVRNKLWLFLRSQGLNSAEKIVFGAATVRRWVLTFGRSADRARLWRGLRSGLRDGLRTSPRENTEVLAGAGSDIAGLIAAVAGSSR